MAKHLSKCMETRDELSTTCNPKRLCQDASQREREFIRYMPSPFYPSSVVLFQLHGGMVSHMQVLATHLTTYNTKYLDPYL